MGVFYALAAGAILISAFHAWRGDLGSPSASLMLGAFVALGGVGFCALLTTVVGLMGAVFRIHSLLTPGLVLTSVMILCAKAAGVLVVGSLAVAGVEKFAIRRAFRASERISAAIEAYAAIHDAPPRSLNELIPEHLPHLPGTTLSDTPRFGYRTDGRGGGWRLSIHASMGAYERGPASEEFEYVSLVSAGSSER